MTDNVKTIGTGGKCIGSKALAERWDISPSTLANMRTYGTGPRYFKIGSTVRYRLSDIEAYETEHFVEPVA